LPDFALTIARFGLTQAESVVRKGVSVRNNHD